MIKKALKSPRGSNNPILNKLKVMSKERHSQQKLEESQGTAQVSIKKPKIPAAMLQTLKQKYSQKAQSEARSPTVRNKNNPSPKIRNETDVILCQICECQFQKPTNQLFMSECQHKQNFCQSCLHHYAIYKIKTFQEVYCPSQHCTSRLDVNTTFFKQLPSEIQKKYIRIHQFYSQSEHPNQLLCFVQNCEGILIKNGDNKLICSSCQVETCPKCNLKFHEGECNQHQIKFFQENFHYRTCRQCKTIIEKNQGCNHMTCKCGFQFCYICGEEWNSTHYTRHNHEERELRRGPLIDCRCLDQNCGATFALILKTPFKGLLFICLILLKIIIFMARDFWLIFGLVLTCCMAGSTGFAITKLCKLSSYKLVLGVIFFPVIACLGIKQAFEVLFLEFIRTFCEDYHRQFLQSIEEITAI